MLVGQEAGELLVGHDAQHVLVAIQRGPFGEAESVMRPVQFLGERVKRRRACDPYVFAGSDPRLLPSSQPEFPRREELRQIGAVVQEYLSILAVFADPADDAVVRLVVRGIARHMEPPCFLLGSRYARHEAEQAVLRGGDVRTFKSRHDAYERNAPVEEFTFCHEYLPNSENPAGSIRGAIAFWPARAYGCGRRTNRQPKEALMERYGVLPMQMLAELMALGDIEGVTPRYLNPASIDLPLSEEAYRMQSGFLIPPGLTVREFFPRVGATPHDLKHPLEVGVPYLIRVDGAWRLPDGIHGRVNPKSSTGRIFLSARIVADRVSVYDKLTAGWSGEMWVLVRPEYFPVRISPGIALSQVRLFEGHTPPLGRLELDFATRRTGLLFDEDKRRIRKPEQDGESLFLSVLVGENMGWECRGSRRILNLAGTGQDPADFFEPVISRDGALSLRKGSAYILATRERVMVPPAFSAELRATDPQFGEFRVHSAGFIDPGWGCGADGNACGRPITLEVTAHEDLYLLSGQNVACIQYERMLEVPDIPYDEGGANYGSQDGPALAKFFKK